MNARVPMCTFQMQIIQFQLPFRLAVQNLGIYHQCLSRHHL